MPVPASGYRQHPNVFAVLIETADPIPGPRAVGSPCCATKLGSGGLRGFRSRLLQFKRDGLGSGKLLHFTGPIRLLKDEQSGGKLKHGADEPFARIAGHLQQAQDAAGRLKAE
jgi:hypothetical protein